jgi:putative glutamine amidotransferase
VTRPRIGVTLAHDTRTQGRFSLRHDYTRAVEAAGGLFFGLAPGQAKDADEILSNIDGLVLSGGSDVDPRIFGETRHPSVNEAEIFRDRDVFEIALSRAAVERDVPVLAICRGMQVLNVALGGTLVQDIPTQIPGHVDHDSGGERHGHAHDVTVERDSQLFEILGRRAVLPVNSFHHQAVAALGAGLTVSARADDGVIEAVERRDRRFVVGVQWHPEGFVGHGDDFATLFRAFVESCGVPCRA